MRHSRREAEGAQLTEGCTGPMFKVWVLLGEKRGIIDGF